MCQQFHEGDQVKIRNRAPFFGNDIIGTIISVYLSVDNLYEVQIAATGELRIERGERLELVTPPANVSRPIVP